MHLRIPALSVGKVINAHVTRTHMQTTRTKR